MEYFFLKTKMPFQYLNPGMVEKHGHVVDSQGHPIKDNSEKIYKIVIVYDRVIFKVCPNPDDERRANDVEEQYQLGMFIDKQTYGLTEERFNDPTFWNS